ncbi:EpsG family protein [Providencia rettgeri]
MINSKNTYVFFIAIAPILFITPIWIIIISLSFIIYINKIKPLNILLCLLLIIYTSLFTSGIDLVGDIGNYKNLYLNIQNSSYTIEYSAEPLILYLYKASVFLGLSFSNLLLLQSLTLSLILLSCCLNIFKDKGLNYFSIILIFNQYLQLNLYLSRQTLAIILFLWFLSYNKTKVLKLAGLALAIFSHTITLLYLTLTLISKKIKINGRLFLILLLFFIAYPINEESTLYLLSNLYDYSESINRKISFYFNRNFLDESLGLFSTLMFPLHFIFLLLLINLIKNRKKSFPQDSITILFLFSYFILISMREIAILPMRISLISSMFSPLFFFYIRDNVVNLNYRIKKLLTIPFLLIIFLSFIKFIYTNDYNPGNITFLDGNALTTYLFSERFFQ